jgi:hypothetical protein
MNERIALLTLLLALFVFAGCGLGGDDDDNGNGTGPGPEDTGWMHVLTDGDTGTAPNVDSLFVRSSESELQFKLTTHGTWADPWDALAGFTAAFLLDTDRDPITGLSASDQHYYSPNDIGADHLLVAGAEDLALFTWDEAAGEWSSRTGLTTSSLPADTNVLVAGVSLAELDDPAGLDLVVGWTLYREQEQVLDWAPDHGHISVPIDHAWTGRYQPLGPTPAERTPAASPASPVPAFWLR